MKHETYIKCIEAEPNLVGDIPDPLLRDIRKAVKKGDTDKITRIFNRVVDATKQGIIARINITKEMSDDAIYRSADQCEFSQG